MALKSGRVGVSPADVDNRGHVVSGGMTPEQSAKLDRALLTPITKPTENVVVGVGIGNEQIIVKIGSGLKLTGETSPYTLESDGTGGGGGELYLNSNSKKASQRIDAASEKVVSDGTSTAFAMSVTFADIQKARVYVDVSSISDFIGVCDAGIVPSSYSTGADVLNLVEFSVDENGKGVFEIEMPSELSGNGFIIFSKRVPVTVGTKGANIATIKIA